MVNTINYSIEVERAHHHFSHIRIPVQNMMTNYERKVLATLCLQNKKTGNIFEFGTWEGLTTRYLSEVFSDGKIYTIDFPKEMGDTNMLPEQAMEFLTMENIGQEWKASRKENVVQFYDDSFKFDISNVPPCDAVLVDGNHSYDYVKSDSHKGLLMLREGGILILHDFGDNPDAINEGVVRYVTESHLNWYRIKNTALVFTFKS